MQDVGRRTWRNGQKPSAFVGQIAELFAVLLSSALFRPIIDSPYLYKLGCDCCENPKFPAFQSWSISSVNEPYSCATVSVW